MKGRGLDNETIARFRIGYAPDSGFLLRDALRREFDEELLRESGLFSWKETAAAPEPRAANDQPQGPDQQTAEPQTEAPNANGEPQTANREQPTSGDQAHGDPSSPEVPGSKPEPRGSQLAAIYSKFRNRVMFPIANEQGKVIAFTGRTLSSDEKAGP